MLTISFFGILVFCYVFFFFSKELSRSIPVLETMLLIAGLQWIIAPIIEYSFPGDHYKYYMYTDQKTYMDIVVPLYTIFVFFTLYGKSKEKINLENLKKYISQKKDLGIILLFTGFISSILEQYSPDSLSFIFFLLGLLKIPGLAIIFFDERIKNYWIIPPLLFELIIGVKSGLFHEFILTSLFTLLCITVGKRIKLTTLIFFIFVSAIALKTLQGVKKYYRGIIWATEASINTIDALEKAYELAESNNSDDGFSIDPRFNQGWIISKIIDYNDNANIKQNTVLSSLSAILLPRFLFPDKKTVVSKDTFESLTGLELGRGTSMGPSLLGEFYANFGFMGAAIAFALWGTLLKLVYNKFIALQKTYPLFPFWLVIVFYQIVKAETMFIKVGNHLFKSILIIILIHLIIPELLKLKKYVPNNEVHL